MMNLRKWMARAGGGGDAAARAARQLVARADRARDARDWGAAASNYAAALERDARRAPIWVQYGHALKEAGQREQAQAAYLKALELEPEVADTHLQLGHLMKVMGRSREAAAHYLRSLELDPAQPDALRELQAVTAGGASGLPPQRVEAVLRRVPGARDDAAAAAPRSDSPIPETLPLNVATLQQQLGELIALYREGAHGGPAARPPGIQLAVDPASLQSLDAAFAILQDMTLRAGAAGAASADGAGHEGGGPQLVFDVSDLIQYFRNARLPTGIQRVQLETITHLLSASATRRQVRLCCFVEQRDYWLEVPALTFVRLCQLSLADGDAKAPEWRGAVGQLDILLNTSEAFAFPRGAYLVNLGTSWWLQNYFLYVRLARQRYDIRYVPFVHDLIPVMTPEHCTKELTQDFITWILGVFQHADFFLANSEATKRDLLKVAATLGHTVREDAVAVVRLDADVRKPQQRPTHDDRARLAVRGLERQPYVLFVSTVESRKNHLGALNAWLRLIRERGERRVPMLVCVGNRGWLNDAVFEKLASSEALQRRVLMLSGIPDDELGRLYRHCLFTLYPSHYEGWGLPVTESLCYGKVPLVSDASSLPESGGEFAVYFESGSDSRLYAALERLIDDDAYRREREAAIAARFRPRNWRDIGLQIEQRIAGWAPAEPRGAGLRAAARADGGRYYPMVRNFETRIWRGMIAAEMFRADEGWWWPDAWGCWTKPQGGTLAFGVVAPAGTPDARELCGYFGLLGLPGTATTFRFEVQGAPPVEGRLEAGQTRWLVIPFPAPAQPHEPVRVSVRGAASVDLAPLTQGLDQRVVGIGFVGFFICDAADARRRLEFVEAYTFGNLAALAGPGPGPGPGAAGEARTLSAAARADGQAGDAPDRADAEVHEAGPVRAGAYAD